jgi:hypothetical protein
MVTTKSVIRGLRSPSGIVSGSGGSRPAGSSAPKLTSRASRLLDRADGEALDDVEAVVGEVDCRRRAGPSAHSAVLGASRAAADHRDLDVAADEQGGAKGTMKSWAPSSLPSAGGCRGSGLSGSDPAIGSMSMKDGRALRDVSASWWGAGP